MKKHYLLCVITILCLILNTSFADDKFKKVKTAEDVINNYIIAIGGKDRLAKITSVEFNGSLSVMNMSADLMVYQAKNTLYTEIKGDMMNVKMVIDGDKGWNSQNGDLKILTAEEVQAENERLSYQGFPFYLNFEKTGVKAELLNRDSISGKPVYTINYTKDGKFIRTEYFDAQTFLILKSKSPAPEGQKSMGEFIKSEFSDYREVPGTGIIKPFTISQMFKMEIWEYKFNTEIDKKLLLPPEEKKAPDTDGKL